MKRREFIAGLGGAAAWPLVTQAQERALPTIGWLHSSLDREQDYIPAFYRGFLCITSIEHARPDASRAGAGRARSW
jgi:hypothetical protein